MASLLGCHLEFGCHLERRFGGLRAKGSRKICGSGSEAMQRVCKTPTLGGFGRLIRGALQLILLEHHVAILDGVEDLAALLALNELRVLIPRNDADLGMSALHGNGLYRRNGTIFTRPRACVNPVFR